MLFAHRLALLSVALVIPLAASAQTRPETIRGRVTSDSGAAIAGATVSATMAPDRSFLQATTDSSGRFSIHFAAGTGDYLIHVSAVGYTTFRQRLTRAPGDTSLTIDIKLTPTVTRLAAVKVQATKRRPTRGGSDDTGADEQQNEGVFAALAPGDEGNLAAIANSIPGASVRDGGLSVYDPSRGGFGGGQTAISLSAGSRMSPADRTSRSMRHRFRHPARSPTSSASASRA